MQEPVVLEEVRHPIEVANYRNRSAVIADCTRFIDQPTVIYDTEQQKVSVVYLELDDDCRDVVRLLKRVKYRAQGRTSGLLSASRTFGYAPRNTIRRDYCNAASLGRDDAEAHDVVMSYAERVSRHYQQYNPELYAEHQACVEKVLPDWKVGSSVFTSGIINKDNPMAYHHDAGNFKDVWSNMLVFKNRVGGGHLAVPEYDACFELKNNSLLMFDGQSLIHGVTPIQKKRADAYRFSIVFYSLQQMWKCLTPEQELQRFKKVRSEREYKRLTQPRRNGTQQ